MTSTYYTCLPSKIKLHQNQLQKALSFYCIKIKTLQCLNRIWCCEMTLESYGTHWMTYLRICKSNGNKSTKGYRLTSELFKNELHNMRPCLKIKRFRQRRFAQQHKSSDHAAIQEQQNKKRNADKTEHPSSYTTRRFGRFPLLLARAFLLAICCIVMDSLRLYTT